MSGAAQHSNRFSSWAFGLRQGRRLLGTIAVFGMVALPGCAAEQGWPQASDFSRITQKVLSPQEQQQAIDGLESGQRTQQAKAIKTIEGPPGH